MTAAFTEIMVAKSSLKVFEFYSCSIKPLTVLENAPQKYLELLEKYSD